RLSGITEVKIVNLSSKSKPVTFFVKEDRTFYEYRYPINILPNLVSLWGLFRELQEAVKKEIVESVLENGQRSMLIIRYRNEPFENYIEQIQQRINVSTTTHSPSALSNKTEDDDD